MDEELIDVAKEVSHCLDVTASEGMTSIEWGAYQQENIVLFTLNNKEYCVIVTKLKRKKEGEN